MKMPRRVQVKPHGFLATAAPARCNLSVSSFICQRKSPQYADGRFDRHQSRCGCGNEDINQASTGTQGQSLC